MTAEIEKELANMDLDKYDQEDSKSLSKLISIRWVDIHIRDADVEA